jgi:Flp pilus assembly protein TadD
VQAFRNSGTQIVIAFSLMSLSAAGAWNCSADGRREVCVDGPARRAQSVLEDLRALENAWIVKNGKLPAAIPGIQAMLYRNKSEFQPFQLISTSLGLFQSGPDKDWIMVLDQGESSVRAARHEWVHMALHHTTPGLPLWLEEGLAEYWSTLESSGGQARLGKPIESHIRLLADRQWLTAQELFSATKQADAYLDERRAGLLYAQAWAVVHLLAQHQEWKGRLEAYVATVATGADAREAFRLTWGRSQEEALEAARSWVRPGLATSEVIVLGTVGDAGPPRSRTLDEAGGLMMRADALLAHSRPNDAQSLIEEAARRGGNRPEVVAARAFITLQRGDKAAALKLLEEAITKGDRRGSVMLERAMLMRETGAPVAQVRSALEGAVQENPGLAEGWHLLGNMAASSGDTARAVEAAEKAASILPRQSGFWESLGRAYLSAGRPVDASNAAAKALMSASTANERTMAEGLSKDVAAWRRPEPARSAKPWFQVPEGWQGPKPDTTISGRLLDVNCGTNTLLFTVETGPKQRTVLRAADPSKIFLRQQEGEKREFVCGSQKPVLLVEAGYHAGTEAATKSAGELIVLAIQGVETPPPPPAKKQPAAKKAPAKKTAPSAKKK